MLDKKSYIEQVTAEILFKILEQINPLDYADMTDVTTTANTPTVEGEDSVITAWRAEANKVLLWITNLWILRNEHVNALEFPTASSTTEFTNSLPPLTL